MKAHVGSLVSGARGQRKFSSEDILVETGLELQSLQDMEAARVAKEEEQRRENEAAQAVAGSDTITGATFDAPIPATDDGTARKRRRGSQPVDYAALDRKLRSA